MESSECRMQNPKMQKHNDLKDRTRRFALAVITFCEHLPKDKTSKILGPQSVRITGQHAARNQKPTLYPRWAPCSRRRTRLDIGPSSYPRRTRWTRKRQCHYYVKQTSWLRSRFRRSTPPGKTEGLGNNLHQATGKIGAGSYSAICIMHFAFSPPGLCHFNKEQTPLAILRYQPAVSRRLFRCLGAHLLRSP